MWSDPEDIENWAVSPRGAGWLFGGSVVKEVKLSFFREFVPFFLICLLRLPFLSSITSIHSILLLALIN